MKHDVLVNLDEIAVEHKDLEIVVRTDGQKLGTLLISRGNIEWKPTRHHVNKIQYTWEDFAKLMIRGKRRRHVRAK